MTMRFVSCLATFAAAFLTPLATGQWIPLDAVVEEVANPSKDRLVECIRVHATYREQVFRIELRRQRAPLLPWARTDQVPFPGIDDLAELYAAEEQFLSGLIRASLIEGGAAERLRLLGVTERLSADPIGSSLLQGSLPGIVESLASRCGADRDPLILDRYHDTRVRQASLLRRTERQLAQARLEWHRATGGLGRFSIEPDDLLDPTWRETISVWHRALGAAYGSDQEIREGIASVARQAARSKDLTERVLAAQVLRGLAGLSGDRLLDGIGIASVSGAGFGSRTLATDYVDSVFDEIPEDSIFNDTIPGTDVRRPGAPRPINHALERLKVHHLAALNHLQRGVPQPSRVGARPGRAAWPDTGSVTDFLPPPPEDIRDHLSLLASDVGSSAYLAWAEDARMASAEVLAVADQYKIGRVVDQGVSRFSDPAEVALTLDWIAARRAEAAARDRKFVESVTEIDDAAASDLRSVLAIAFCWASGLSETRPDELQMDFLGLIREATQPSQLKDSTGQLDSLADAWIEFAVLEFEYWGATQESAAAQRVPNPEEPNWDQIDDPAEAQAALRQAVSDLAGQKRAARDRVGRSREQMFRARSRVILMQRAMAQDLVEAGALEVRAYSNAAFPRVFTESTSFLRSTRELAHHPDNGPALYQELVAGPVSQLVAIDHEARLAAAVSGHDIRSRFEEVLADLRVVASVLAR